MIRHPIPKVYKIILASTEASRSSDNFTTATFDNVKIPHTFARQAVLVVESFRVLNGDSGATANHVYNVRLENMTHPNSYSSHTGGMTDVILTNTGYTFSQQCTVDNISATFQVDPTSFMQKSITVTIDSYVNPTFSWTQAWVLTLLIYERSTSEILG